MAAVQGEERRPGPDPGRLDLHGVLLSHGRDRPNLVLCGFMGTGKTAVGKALAQLYHLDPVDTDAMLASRVGMPAGDYLAVHGEARFRDLERQVVQDAAHLRGAVISTGGGVPLDPRNLDALASTGVLFLLEARPSTLARRLVGDTTRPLLAGADEGSLAAQLEGRAEAYDRVSERVQTDGRQPEDIAREVYGRYLRQLRSRS